MQLVFLSARLPLTKTFALQNKQMISAPYPLVSRVTSHQRDVNTLPEFHKALQEHAKQNHCLLSGRVAHPLRDESRAGKALRENRWWICFDFDKVKGKSTEEVVKKYLPDYCQNVSYIAQLSASMFRPDTKTWSGHIFMLLKKEVGERYLKQWFEHLNFAVPALEKSITLTDSLQALHWPLDRTVADCSKIIYIAPPLCHGFTPKVLPGDSIVLVTKKESGLEIPPFEPVSSADIRFKLNALRREVGETELQYNVVQHNGEDLLLDAAPCDVHGTRSSGDHYIRFNLNGGDSYAYFIDLRNPAIIRNFKGEPFLKTEDVAPELYKTLKKTAPKSVAAGPLDEETDILAFYATNRGSSVQIGSYEPVSRALVLNPANETSAKAWLYEHSLFSKGYLPHIDVVFDPLNYVQHIPGSGSINTFRPTEYMMNANAQADAKPKLSSMPAAIQKTIRSMLGDPDDVLLDHYINWLACIFQYREKTATAWVLHGMPGTGKSTFVKDVLTPLFGPEHVKVVQFGIAQGEFNAFLENSLFVIFEEADTRAVQNSATLNAKLKHWITDSPVEIRKMRTDSYSSPNYSNFIFNSNERTPAHVASDDRRFNFGNRQDNKLFYTPNEIKSLIAGTELLAFAKFLHSWPVDKLQARTVIENKAKADVHEATTSINQLIAEAVIRGDLQFFIDRMPSDAEAQADFHNKFNTLGLFKDKLGTYTSDAETPQKSLVKDEDLFILFRTLIPDTRFFQDSKTWRKRHYKALGLNLEGQHRVPGRPQDRERGMLIQWLAPEYKIAEAPKPTNKVVSIGRKK